MKRVTMPWLCSSPVEAVKQRGVEEKAFPHLFPRGRGGMACFVYRKVPLLKRFAGRLLCKDSRFRTAPELLLFMEAVARRYELDRAVHVHCSSIGFSDEADGDQKRGGSRRRGGRQQRGPVNAAPRQPPTARELLEHAPTEWVRKFGGYSWMSSVRGTMSYWDSVRGNAYAMLEQLGSPSIFLTVNPPNLVEWPHFFVSIGKFKTIAEVCSNC